MRAKTILVVLFLISLAVISLLVLRALPNLTPRANETASAAPAPEPVREVLVATVRLQARTLLRAQDVEWKEIRGAGAPDEFYRPNDAVRQVNAGADAQVKSSVYGAALIGDVDAGQPLRRGTIVEPGDRDFLPVVLRPGMRAIAIPVATGGASTGLLSPGDRVDVLLTQTFKDKVQTLSRSAVGETVLQDLRVVAIDPPDKAKDGGFGRTVTLEVSPSQAEKLNVAAELGKLTVTLRSNGGVVADDRSDNTNAGLNNINAGLNNQGFTRAEWAGDVSPALGPANQPPVVAEPPTISIIRGATSQPVKTR